MLKKLFIFTMLLALGVLPSTFAQQIKAVSFNIRNSKNSNIDAENSWHLRRDAVIDFIRDEKPDVICLQDALIDQLSYIDNSFRKKYRRIGLGADNGISKGSYNAIYYDTASVELSWHTTRWLSKTPRQTSNGWDEQKRRTVTIALFRDKYSNKQFYVFNTHLGNLNTIAYPESIKLLNELIDSYAKQNTPVILAGCFNATDLEPLLIQFYNNDIMSARRTAEKTDFRNTYNAFGKGEQSMIDHIFIRNISVQPFKTIVKNYGAKFISDHYPVYIVFSL